jgi:hypothetical protein
MKLFNIFCIFFIFISISHGLNAHQSPNYLNTMNSFQDIWNADIILADANDPFYCLLASTLACYYPTQTNISVLTPLLVTNGPQISDQQDRFITSYEKNPRLLCLGMDPLGKYDTKSFQENAVDLSLILASSFPPHSEVILIPYDLGMNYSLSLQATLLSSYLHIPLLILKDNIKEVNGYIKNNSIKEVYIVGNINPEIVQAEKTIHMTNAHLLSNQILPIIKDTFGTLNYITITNPKDTQSPEIRSIGIKSLTNKAFHQSITLLGKTITLQGKPSYEFNITIPKGIHHLESIIEYHPDSPQQVIYDIEPLVYCRLKDPNGTIIGYSQSSSYEIGTIYIDTLIVDHPP